MGKLVAGTWIADDAAATDAQGRWQRSPSQLRGWLTPDGREGPNGEPGFPLAPSRYQLYAAWNCPWAHRALLTRAIKGLQAEIPVAFVAPRRTDQGWVFDPEGGYPDPLYGHTALHQLYTRGHPDYTGRVTVPVLWDRKSEQVVSNESADLVRMLNAAYPERGPDLYPEGLRDAIDGWNELIHRDVNNGVYKAGFAETQQAYEAAAWAVFEALDRIEAQLRETPFLAGERFTEADLRLFPTLARFDVAYHTAFKCNLYRLSDYPQLWDYARAIYQSPGVAETVAFDIYKRGYFSPSEKRNPLGIVPIGPVVDWDRPASRPAIA